MIRLTSFRSRGGCLRKGLPLGAVFSGILLIGSSISTLPQTTEPPSQLAPQAVNPNFPWNATYIDSLGNVGEYISATITSSGTRWVSYYDRANGDLKAAHFVGANGNCGTGNSWHCDTVDSTGDVGRNSSIASYQNTVAIAYQDTTNRSLKLATRFCVGNLCNWIKTVIEAPQTGDSIESYISLKFTSSGDANIVYFLKDSNATLNQLRFARPVPSGGACIGTASDKWDCEQVFSGYDTGSHASLDFETFGTPCIAHVSETGPPQQLWYSCRPDTQWNHLMIESAGQVKYPYLDIQSSNSKARIAYYQGATGRLRMAEYVGNNPSVANCGFDNNLKHNDWYCYEVDNIGITVSHVGISMDVDNWGNPMVAYLDAYSGYNNSRLKAAYYVGTGGNCGPSNRWRCDILDYGSQYNDEASSVSIVLNPVGLAYIAYCEYDSYNDIFRAKMMSQYFKIGLPLTRR